MYQFYFEIQTWNFMFVAGKELSELVSYCLEPLFSGLLQNYYDGMLHRYLFHF